MANASNEARGLKGVRVIDFGQYIAGPLTAMLLADQGADVIHIDPPTGPVWDHPANAILNRNKRSITLDLKDASDLAFARDLISTADIVIENFRPGVMKRLGLDAEELCSGNPALIWCSLPGFGHDDPRATLAAYEGIICSAASLYPPKLRQNVGGPDFSAIPYASNFGAFVAAHSIAAALVSRHRYQRGDRIEVPLYDAVTEANAICLETPPSIQREWVMEMMHKAAISNPAAGKQYKCRDGRMLRRDIPARGLHKFWDRYLPAELKGDVSAAGVARAERLLTDLFLSRDANDWERDAQTECQAAFGTHQTTLEWLHDDHALASRSVIEVEDPELGPTVQAGFAIRIDTLPALAQPRHLPGSDNDSMRAEVRDLLALRVASKARAGAPAQPTAPARLPLAGMRVLDFTTLVAGPGGSRILAEYGAEVIKCTKTALGFERLNPRSDDPLMYSGHRTTSAGKKSMFLDLRQEEGREIAHLLAATADVACVNLATGSAEQLGIGEADLRAVQPNIIYATTNLHAKGGWRETFRGHEQVAQSVTGVSIRFGGEDEPKDLPLLMNDYGTAHLSAFGMLIALLDRLRGGGGATVEAALSRTSTVSQIPFTIDYAGRAIQEPSGQDARGWSIFDRLYQCADGWIYVAALKPASKAGLRSIRALSGCFDRAEGEIEQCLERAFAQAEVTSWLAELDRAAVPAHAYYDLYHEERRKLLRERRMLAMKEHPGLAPGEVMGIAARFASNPDRVVPGAVRPGYHTAEILEQLGLGANRVAQLIGTEVVAGPMPAGSVIDQAAVPA